MRKMTKAYQLKPITESVKAFHYENTWYPITEREIKEKEIFIYGQGWKRFTSSMHRSLVDIESLPVNWTAQDIKDRASSLAVAMGLLHGWCNASLFQDRSIGLDYAKSELSNMYKYGKLYDDFTDRVHEVGQRFITSLFKKGYRLEGGWLWYNDKLIGKTGLYGSIRLHITQHIQHRISVFNIGPSFDPIGFENMLIELIKARRGHTSILNKYVSVKERAGFLSSQKIANDIEKIFVWQELD